MIYKALKQLAEWGKTWYNIRIDKYVIMPNHIHMIVIFRPKGGRPRSVVPTTDCA